MSKVCVIAGAGPGNGLSLGKRFAADGYSVVLLARSESTLQTLSEQIPGAANAAPIKVNVVPDYTVYNGRLTYMSPSAKWSISLEVKNLFDEFRSPQAVAAAYNGSEDSVRRWIARAGSSEPDRFVVLDGVWKDSTVDFLRRPDGSIGWLRTGRLHIKQD